MWQKILFEELENRNIGLVCVTRANLESRWLNFEAGAIAKKVVETAKLCPVLIDLPKSDLPLPLSSFQMKLLEKNDVLAICEMINANGDQPLSEKDLHHAFRVQWQEFEKAFSEAKRTEPDSEKAPRPDRELLEEILSRVRSLGALEEKPPRDLSAFPYASSHEATVGLLLPKFRSAIDQLDKGVWSLLSTAAPLYLGGFVNFTFPPQYRDVFDLLTKPGPKRDVIKHASQTSGLKVGLICEGDSVGFDDT